MKITGRQYALAAAKANSENKILRLRNGEFIFEPAPVVADEEVLFGEVEDGLGHIDKDD